MESGFYSLSSKRLPGKLGLEIHHGFDFEIPLSQANYIFLEYKFSHEDGATALARVYLDNWSIGDAIKLDREVEITPNFEPYKREKLPKDFISSVLLTMSALGYSACFDDFEDKKIKLNDLYDANQLETVKSNWIKQMDGKKV